MFYTKKLDKKHILLCTFNKLILWCERSQLWLKNMLPKQNLKFNCSCLIIVEFYLNVLYLKYEHTFSVTISEKSVLVLCYKMILVLFLQ